MAKTYREAYRENLLKTVVDLNDFIEKLDFNIVNLGMSGEFSDVDALFEIGDELRLEIADFEKADDQNVQYLIRIFFLVTEVSRSIKNINNISNEELEGSDELPF